ncbi:hypothetical protein PR048_010129, partial [Dryococelus australis]
MMASYRSVKTCSHRDVDSTQLHQELIALHSLCDAAKSVNGLLEVLKYISANSLCDNFPNLSVALRCLLTLPVAVASGESSFSQLKIIKNYLRSTMSQERLVGLAIMSIDHYIDTDTIIKTFAEKKARK